MASPNQKRTVLERDNDTHMSSENIYHDGGVSPGEEETKESSPPCKKQIAAQSEADLPVSGKSDGQLCLEQGKQEVQAPAAARNAEESRNNMSVAARLPDVARLPPSRNDSRNDMRLPPPPRHEPPPASAAAAAAAAQNVEESRNDTNVVARLPVACLPPSRNDTNVAARLPPPPRREPPPAAAAAGAPPPPPPAAAAQELAARMAQRQEAHRFRRRQALVAAPALEGQEPPLALPSRAARRQALRQEPAQEPVALGRGHHRPVHHLRIQPAIERQQQEAPGGHRQPAAAAQIVAQRRQAALRIRREERVRQREVREAQVNEQLRRNAQARAEQAREAAQSLAQERRHLVSFPPGTYTCTTCCATPISPEEFGNGPGAMQHSRLQWSVHCIYQQ